MKMNERQRLIFILTKNKEQGMSSITLDIDTVLKALHQTPSNTPTSQPGNWEADGGDWKESDD